MKVVKTKSAFGYDVNLIEDGKILTIYFSGNLDLYWTIYDKSNNDGNTKTSSFTITKENYYLYSLFEKLYNDIKDINIYNDKEYPLQAENNVDSFLKEFSEIKERLISLRESDRDYHELFNESERKITWRSDETSSEVSNYLEIIKDDESFKLLFHTQEYKDGYNKDFSSPFHIVIRFRNHRSKYSPFNFCFNKMYFAFDALDDTLDEGHQMHMEEYMLARRRGK